MSSYGRIKDSNTQADEHVVLNGVAGKRVILAGWDGVDINDATVDSNGNIAVTSGMGITIWDSVTPTYNATSDVWVFKKGVITVATVTITYQDATKLVITKVEKV